GAGAPPPSAPPPAHTPRRLQEWLRPADRPLEQFRHAVPGPAEAPRRTAAVAPAGSWPPRAGRAGSSWPRSRGAPAVPSPGHTLTPYAGFHSPRARCTRRRLVPAGPRRLADW